MASEDDRPLYDDDDEDVEENSDDIIDDDDVDDDTSSSNLAAVRSSASASAAGVVTVALPADPSHRFATIATVDKKPVVGPERGLFQRLWTDEDEIEILRGFLDHISRRGGAHDAAVFYEEIKGKLQLEFNKSQLVEKLRRLKKKYRTAMGKVHSGKDYAFKSPHDQATFEISKKIWFEQPATRFVEDEESKPNHNNFISFHHNHNNGGNGMDLNLKGSATPKKRPRPVKSEEMPQFSLPIPQVSSTPVANSIPGVIEETVKSCLNPIFKELVQSAKSSNSRSLGNMMGFNPMGGNFGSPGPLGFVAGGDMGGAMEERWRKQQILELEVYSKRLALVQDQIKSTMEELRAKGS